MEEIAHLHVLGQRDDHVSVYVHDEHGVDLFSVRRLRALDVLPIARGLHEGPAQHTALHLHVRQQLQNAPCVSLPHQVCVRVWILQELGLCHELPEVDAAGDGLQRVDVAQHRRSVLLVVACNGKAVYDLARVPAHDLCVHVDVALVHHQQLRKLDLAQYG
eukprot:CAMPEP_0173222204 /NCGR_PEP_ID=MMETSP1142-20121109/3132_1 /TAXON_ID=483371 /ORGANISM="non described non described, Strain CCMP2298" /LENGTH=160 /DNA_ID=CAMNT_0014150291 /DNA_START=246 /DNA_END=728 /DNA_ORIENTATION=+